MSKSNNNNNFNEFLIQKSSLFSDKQSKIHLDNIIELLDNPFPNEENESKEIKSNKQIELEMMSHLSISEKLSCNVCNFPFVDRVDQIAHYKSDLHRFNLKRKLNGKVCVSVEEFENLTDVSSISGTDDDEYSDKNDSISENDDENESLKNTNDNACITNNKLLRNDPKIAFKLIDSNVLVMYRCLLYGKKNIPEKADDIISSVKSITNQDQWCIILINAGHFASVIFKGEEIILHKTFHRYVVRAKRGTVQSVHDNAGGHAKSAGAQIRRHQESAFKDDIKSLMEQWKKELDRCKLIFLRAPKYNQQIFFSGKNSIFSKLDIRLRSIPFMTFRPTFNEVKRVHFVLRTLELYNSSYALNSTSDSSNSSNNITSSQFKQQKSPINYKNNLESKIKVNLNQLNTSVQQQQQEQYDENEDKSDSNFENSNESDSDSEDENEKSNLNNDSSSYRTPTNKNKRKLKPIEKNEIKKSRESENASASHYNITLDENSLKIYNELYTACITNDLNKLQNMFEKFKLNNAINSNLDATQISANNENKNDSYLNKINFDTIINYRFNKSGLTLLHLTSSLGYSECVKLLLLNGSDPTIATYDEKKVAYLMSKNKTVKDQFKRFMHDYPLLYDYNLAKIPCGLSLEKEIEKQNKEKEKRKLYRKMKKEREQNVKNQQKQIDFESEEKRKFLSLNDDEKRLLMIERKFINIKPTKSFKTSNYDNIEAAVKLTTSKINPERLPTIISRCWFCAENMTTSVPFEYYDYKFCSIKCLKSHRQINNKK